VATNLGFGDGKTARLLGFTDSGKPGFSAEFMLEIAVCSC